MKKFFLALLCFIIVVIAAAWAFLATFDLNKYNKTLAAEISAVVGNPVEIGHISLKWMGKLALEAEKFQVLATENGQKVPKLYFDRAYADLELMPLLQKKVRISNVTVLNLNVHLIKAKDGVMNVSGINPKPGAGSKATKPEGLPADISFSIDSISVKSCSVRFEDQSSQSPADILIDKIDVDIKNVSLDGPVTFDIKMAALSAKQNFSVSGTAGGFKSGPMYIRDMNANMDLAAIDHAKLVKAFPAVEKAGIREGLLGALKVKVNEIALVNNKVERVNADVSFSGGKIVLAQFKAPVENISLFAVADNNKLSVRSFQAGLSNALLKGTADITGIYAVPNTVFKTTLEVPQVKKFCADLFGGKQYLDGKVALSFDGTMSGFTEETIKRTLSGKGVFDLDNGVLIDVNIIKQSLGALSMFPGILDSLNSYLPESMRKSISSEYTLLKPIRQSILISDGVVNLSDLNIGSDFASIKGAATMTLSGELAGNGTISFSQALSDGIIKAVPQMTYLADTSKVISFPVSFKASSSGVSVIPDLKYVATKAVMQKGQEMVADLFKKVSEPKSGAAAAGTQETGQGTTTQASKFDSFLKNIQTIAGEAQGASTQTAK